MKIIKIDAYDNGAHANQTKITDFNSIPEGWAIVPEDMIIPDTYPFVDITVKNGVVTGMIASVIPEPEEEVYIPTEEEKLRADIDYIAAITGVQL